MKKVLFMAVLAVLLEGSEASAQWAGAFLPFGGNSVGQVVASNQAMIWSLAGQAVPWGYPQVVRVIPFGYQEICHGKSGSHVFGDMMFAGATGFGAGLLTVGRQVTLSDWIRAAGGGATGGGIGGLVGKHEKECQIVPIPGFQAQAQAQQAGQPAEPTSPVITQAPPPLAISGLPMVIINESNFWIYVDNEETREAVVVLGPMAEARDLKAPRGRMRFYIIKPTQGVMQGQEIEEVFEDPQLPGFRIPPMPEVKSNP